MIPLIAYMKMVSVFIFPDSPLFLPWFERQLAYFLPKARQWTIILSEFLLYIVIKLCTCMCQTRSAIVSFKCIHIYVHYTLLSSTSRCLLFGKLMIKALSLLKGESNFQAAFQHCRTQSNSGSKATIEAEGIKKLMRTYLLAHLPYSCDD